MVVHARHSKVASNGFVVKLTEDRCAQMFRQGEEKMRAMWLDVTTVEYSIHEDEHAERRIVWWRFERASEQPQGSITLLFVTNPKELRHSHNAGARLDVWLIRWVNTVT